MSPSREDGVGETINFWATWCGPYRAVAPVIEQLAAAFEGRDESLSPAARYGIQSSPTILFFEAGTVVDRVVGVARTAVPPRIVSVRAS